MKLALVNEVLLGMLQLNFIVEISQWGIAQLVELFYFHPCELRFKIPKHPINIYV